MNSCAEGNAYKQLQLKSCAGNMGVVLTVTNFLDALALAFTNEIHIRYMSLELALVEFGGSNAFAGLKSKSRDEIHTKWDKSNSPCSHLINWF